MTILLSKANYKPWIFSRNLIFIKMLLTNAIFKIIITKKP